MVSWERNTSRGGSERGATGVIVLFVGLAGLVGLGLGVVLFVANVVDPLSDGEPTAIAASGRVDLLDCRGGTPVDTVYDGDSVFVVGVDSTGAWAAIRRPEDLTVVGWLPASALDPSGILAELPIRSCDGSDDIVGMPTEVDSESSTTTTTAPPTDTTQPPTDTTQPPTDTTQPPTDTTQPPTDTTQPPTDTTQPPTDTEPPILRDPFVLPNLIFPETCSPPSDYNTEGSAYLTVASGTEPVTARLLWRYLPTDLYGDYSGELSVLVLPDPANTLLIGAVRELPDPYPNPPISGPPTPAVIEFEWIVSDEAGNTSRALATADLGRCL